MPSLMERLRGFFGVEGPASDEQVKASERLKEHQLRLAGIDAIVEARRRGYERRHMTLPGHPMRRADDA